MTQDYYIEIYSRISSAVLQEAATEESAVAILNALGLLFAQAYVAAMKAPSEEEFCIIARKAFQDAKGPSAKHLM